MSTLVASRINLSSSRQDWMHYLQPFLILMMIFLVLYSSALSHFTLAIDDESGAFTTDPINWARQGRWVIYLLERWAVSQSTLVFFPIFFFGIFASAGYIVLSQVYDADLRDPRTYLLFVLFCAFPIIFFIANFLGNVLALGIGLAAACVALHYFSKSMLSGSIRDAKPREWLLQFAMQVLCVAVAMGVYQSLMLLVLVGCFGLVAWRVSAKGGLGYKRFLLIHVWIAAIVVCGTLLSGKISHMIWTASGLDQVLKGDYTTQYLHLDSLLHEPLSIIRAAAIEAKSVYGGAAEVYGYRYYTFPLLLALGFAALLHAGRSLKRTQLVGLAMYAAGILCVPFLLNLITGGVLPYRVLIGVPLVFWLFAMFAVFSGSRYIRVAATVILMVVVLQCLYTLSMFQTTRRLALEHDMQLASQIYDRIGATIPGFDRDKIYPIDFYGAYEFKTVYPTIGGDSSLAASFFQWDGGHPIRIIHFMQILGYSNLREVSAEERQNSVVAMASMPIWPQRDSVKFAGGVILVRLGAHPSVIHSGLRANALSRLPVAEIWKFDGASSGFHVVNATVKGPSGAGIAISAGQDVQIILSTGRPDLMGRCQTLRVSAGVTAEHPDIAQLFYQDPATGNFNGANFAKAQVGASGRVDFVMNNPNGFQDRLRLDPVMSSQSSRLSDLTVNCAQWIQ